MELTKDPRKFEKLRGALLNLGADNQQNISLLVNTCGQLLDADGCLYNRIEEDLIFPVAGWKLFSHLKEVDKAEGHICYDLVKKIPPRKILIVKNLPRTSYFKTDPNVRLYDLKTYAGFPVSYAGKVRGSLCVVYRRNVNLTKEDILIMELIASFIGVEEERRLLGEKIHRRIKFEELISQLATDFINVSEGELDNMINRALKEIGEFCGVDRSYIFLIYDRGKKVRNTHEWCAEGVESWIDRLQNINIKDFLWFFQKMKNKEIVYFSDIEILPKEALNLKRLLKKQKVISMLCVPMVHEGEVIGFLGFDSVKKPKEWSNTDINTLNIAGEMFSSLIIEKQNRQRLMRTNAKLREISLKDPLTGLYNQRYFEELIEREFQRAKRQILPLSVLMIDLDYFKSINELYGFYFGDLVLRQLAKRLKSMVRKYDVLIRYAGEEFVIVAPAITRSEGLELAKRILENINTSYFGKGSQKIKIKLSIAVVSYPEDEIYQAKDIIELLEKILLEAKERGGNIILSSLEIKKEKPQYLKTLSFDKIDALRRNIDRLTRKTNQSLMESIYAFARTIEAKDQYTGEHVERTVYYAVEIAKRLYLSNQEIEYIRQAAILHDLGKIGISEKILLKKNRLTHDEFLEIKNHPRIAVEILRPVHFLYPVIPIILGHHERWDGKGYPNGLKKEEIPLGARILAVADVFQALISDRPYRKAFSFKEAVEIIKKGRGSHFDPRVVDTFLEILKNHSKNI